MEAALLCHFFLQSTLEMKAEGVHSPASFSFSPSARVCGGDMYGCLPLVLHISSEVWSTTGFLSVTEVNVFALVLPNT